MKKINPIKEGLDLINQCDIAMLGNNGKNGYPNIKAMLKIKNEGLKTVWFGTNTSAKRTAIMKKDKRVCVYFLDSGTPFRGLMLVGDIEVSQDNKLRKMLWREGFERYYPKGMFDPDYSVLKFTAKYGNYYSRLQNNTFKIKK